MGPLEVQEVYYPGIKEETWDSKKGKKSAQSSPSLLSPVQDPEGARSLCQALPMPWGPHAQGNPCGNQTWAEVESRGGTGVLETGLVGCGES